MLYEVITGWTSGITDVEQWSLTVQPLDGEDRADRAAETGVITSYSIHYTKLYEDAQDLLPAYAFTPDGQSIVMTIGGKISRVDVTTGSATVIPFNAHVAQEVAEPIRVERRVADDELDVKVLRWASISPDGNSLVFSAIGKIS